MSIFDNATSITIGDKEVASITIDGGTVYEKSSGESRDITFKLMAGNEPYHQSNVPVTVDGVTENTDENGEVIFNLVDGSHAVKIISRVEERCSTVYDQTHITDANSTQQPMNIILSTNIEFEFVDKDTKEVIEDAYYWVAIIDTNCNSIVTEGSFRTGSDSGYMASSRYTFKVYENEAKSELLDEVTTSQNDTKATFEVPSPPQPHTLSFSLKSPTDVAISDVTVTLCNAEYTEIGYSTTGSAGGCTIQDILDGTYWIKLESDMYGNLGQHTVSINGEEPVLDGSYVSLTVDSETTTSFVIILQDVV